MIEALTVSTPSRATEDPLRRTLWLSAAAVVVAGVGLTAWLWWSTRAPSPNSMAVVQPPVAAPALDYSATFLLVPGPTRSSSAEENLVRIPPGAERVRFSAVLEGAAVATIEASMRKVGGGLLDLPSVTSIRQVPQGTEVSWLVPTAALTVGDYLISYDAALPTGRPETVASRNFRVVR